MSPRRPTGGNHEVETPVGTARQAHNSSSATGTRDAEPARDSATRRRKDLSVKLTGSINTSVPCYALAPRCSHPRPSALHHNHHHAMRPATVAKWLQENANAPPPPATPAGLPDDSASTVYPESSVSNPNASRYTGTRHRGLAVSRVPQQYLERRPSTPQGHRREYHASPAAIPPRPQHQRYQSLSTDSRHSPLQHQPYTYTYAPAQSSPFYLAPGAVRSTGHVGYSRGTGHRTHQTPQYQLVPHPPVRRAETIVSASSLYTVLSA